MAYLFCNDVSLFAFPMNAIALLILVLGTWILHRYYSRHTLVRWFSGIPASLLIIGLSILLLIIEGIWALQLFKSWIFIILQLLLLLILGLLVLQKGVIFKGRNLLFQLNHGGLWLAIAAALFGAPDREEYKMLIPLHQTEYNAIDAEGVLHPLPFTVRLDRFELEYYPSAAGVPQVPKRFCSTLTLKHQKEEKQLPVEVNQPARFQGYSLYQDGYDRHRGSNSEYSILLVVRDPWIAGVYAGIFMLLAGAIGLIVYGPIKKVKS